MTVESISSAHASEEESGLLSLAPAVLSNDEKSKYESEFRFALENDDISNIALSGSYGSGKSTIAKTFARADEKREWLFVSLAHFGDKNQGSSGARDQRVVDEGLRSVEAALLTQIVHKIDLTRAPKSRFRRPVNHESGADARLAIAVVTFVVATVSLVWLLSKDSAQPASPYWVSFLALFVVWSALAYAGVYRAIRANTLGRFVKRLRFMDAEVELAEPDTGSVIDQYMNDLVYLINNSGYDVIVFEDLDRFDSVFLFEKLREVNLLANDERKDSSRRVQRSVADRCPIARHRRGARASAEQQSLKFIYLVRDSLFASASDRTKFFDFIIPVIPYLDPSNAFDLLRLKLSDVGIEVSDEFLYRLSLFVDDSRILCDMVNECGHFKQALFGAEKISREDAEHLAAMVSYKVYFPRDFEKLQIRQGYLYALLNNKQTLIEQYIRDGVSERGSREPIGEFELERRSVSELLNLSDEIDGYFKPSETIQIKGHINGNYIESIMKDVHYPLIRFLVIGGWVDESYSRFISNHYPESLNSEDRNYLMSIIQGISVDPAYIPDNPEMIVLQLNEDELHRKSARNFSMYRCLLKQENGSGQNAMSLGILVDEDGLFLANYVCSDEFTPLVFREFIDNSWSPIVEIIDNEGLEESRKRLFCQRAVAYGMEEINKKDVASEVLNYANNDENFLVAESDDVEALKKGLFEIGFRPQNLNVEKSNADLLNYVYENGLFAASAKLINALRIKVLSRQDCLSEGGLLSDVLAEDERGPIGVIEGNPDEFVSSIFSTAEHKTRETEKAITWFLALDHLSEKAGIQFIEQLEENSLQHIENVASTCFKRGLLDQNVAVCSFENVMAYFKASGMDESLAKFLNRNGASFSRADTSEFDETDCEKLLVAVAKRNDVFEGTLGELASSLKVKIDPLFVGSGFVSKLSVLVNSDALSMSQDSLGFMRIQFANNRPQLLRYISCNIEEYLSIVLASEGEGARTRFFDESEACELVSSSRIPLANKQVLLKGVGRMRPSEKYDPEINLALLEYHFDEGFVDSLPTLFRTDNSALRELCIDIAERHIEAVIRTDVALPEEMLRELVSRLKSSTDKEAAFIASQMKNGKKSFWEDVDINSLFADAKLLEFQQLVSQTQKTLSDTQSNRNLLEQLKKWGVISGFEAQSGGKLLAKTTKFFRKTHTLQLRE